MSNVIQIKRGKAAPNIQQLAPYELGYSTDKKSLYIHDLENQEIVLLSGEGTAGKEGKDGKSAYEIACENGFEGTEEEWLDSLQGEPGPQGEPGKTPIKGEDYWTEEDRASIVEEFRAVSYNKQTPNEAEKIQARENIGAASSEDLGKLNESILKKLPVPKTQEDYEEMVEKGEVIDGVIYLIVGEYNG